jgi:hypothetical protein
MLFKLRYMGWCANSQLPSIAGGCDLGGVKLVSGFLGIVLPSAVVKS